MAEYERREFIVTRRRLGRREYVKVQGQTGGYGIGLDQAKAVRFRTREEAEAHTYPNWSVVAVNDGAVAS